MYLLVFIQNLLVYLAEKILLMQPPTFGGDYRETFRFTGQDKVFGIRMRGVEPRTLRAQCEKHGIGLKITSQILKVQYGQSGRANDEVDPALMEELAVRLKGLLNLRDVQNQLGASVELVKALIEDGLLTPDFRFNDRMMGFVSATVEAFLEEWLGTAKRIVKNRRATLMLITEVARRYRVSVSRLLRAARSRGAKLYRDHRMKGFRGIFLDEADVLGLIKLARSEGGDHLGRKAAVIEQEDFRQLG